MIGEANNESSHVLCIAIVLVPPIKISDVYCSILTVSVICLTQCLDERRRRNAHLVHGSLRVSHMRNVFDHHTVVGLLTTFDVIQNAI